MNNFNQQIINALPTHGTLTRIGEKANAISSRSSQIAGEVLLSLGDYKFSVGTAAHQKLVKKTDYRWAQVDRLGRKPAQQFLGINAETVSLDGYLLPHFAGGYDQIDQMREMAETGEPQLLIDQQGTILGKFCIKSITETGSILDSNGKPRRIDFAIELIEYGDDR